MSDNKAVKVKEKQSFKWQFSLKDKSFASDPLLPAFLGFHDHKKLSIGQLFSRFDSRQAAEITRAFKGVLSTQESFDTFVIINIPDRRYLVELSIYPMKNKQSAVEGVLSFVQPFPTDEKESEFLREIFDHADVGLMVATDERIIVMVNKAFCEETGYQEHELIGSNTNILKSGHYEPEFYKNLWKEIAKNKVWHGELLAKNKQQEVYTRDVQIQRFIMSDNTHFYFSSSSALDVSSSLLDTQLGVSHHVNVPDKAKYTENVKNCFAKLSSDQTIVMATFNLVFLQKISDDTACWLVSQRFHASKVIGNLGQISKAIYSIYWVEDKNPDKIDASLRKLVTTFSHGFDNGGFDLFTTVNIGVSILSVDAKNPLQLISHSTQTLIANPVKDYSSVYYYDPRLAKRFDRHQVLAKLLKKALNQKSVEVYYQPIVAIPSMEIKEFEALFRIQLETELDYDTQELISIAESYNWIDEIDAMVTQIALDAIPQIQKHYNNPNIAVAINRSLANDKVTHCCLEDTIDILLASKADLNNVTIELTESAIFENFDQQKQWVEELQKHGVKIAIDDFGTGYSSFAYLNNLPVNFIKIDRSFVTGLTFDSNEYAMIKMLCKLAHKIGAKVIAEGVETEEEFTLLSRATVDMLQGYIFSKPTSLETLLAAPAVPYSQTLANCVYHQQKITVGDICIEEFQRVEFDDRLAVIKELMEAEPQRYFIILENKKCRGILYSEDYHSSVSPYIDSKGEQKRDLITLDKRVHQIMKKEFFSLTINSEIELAEQHFSENPYSIIIVTNSIHECIGVTTVQALLKYKRSKQTVN